MDEHRALESRGSGEGGQVTRLKGKWWGVSEGFLEEVASKLGIVRGRWGIMSSFLPHLQVRDLIARGRLQAGSCPTTLTSLLTSLTFGGKTSGRGGNMMQWLSSELRSDRVTWCSDPLLPDCPPGHRWATC